MYIIINHNTIPTLPRFYKLDKNRLLVPTNSPQLFKNYDAAKSAISRTSTFCKKLRKLNLYSGISHGTTAVPKKGTDDWKKLNRRNPEKIQLDAQARKGNFYAFSASSLTIVRVLEPENASTGHISETIEDTYARGEYALKLLILNNWLVDPIDRANSFITRLMKKKSNLTEIEKKLIDITLVKLQLMYPTVEFISVKPDVEYNKLVNGLELNETIIPNAIIDEADIEDYRRIATIPNAPMADQSESLDSTSKTILQNLLEYYRMIVKRDSEKQPLKYNMFGFINNKSIELNEDLNKSLTHTRPKPESNPPTQREYSKTKSTWVGKILNKLKQ